MTVDEFAAGHPDLIATVRRWDLEPSVSLCAGLLLCPTMHGYTFALEAIIHSICVYSNGPVRPSPEDIARLLNALSGFLDESDEFPRDVFVGNVMTAGGNRRFLTGTWETPDFWVQQALDSLRRAPKTETFNTLREQIDTLLSFSEAAMDRNCLNRYAGSIVRPEGKLKLPDEQDLRRAVQTVRLQANQLPASLHVFTTVLNEREKMAGDRLGNSRLEQRPFIQIGPSLLIWALPTATSAALRLLLLQHMQRTGNLPQFSRVLRAVQNHFFYDDLLHARAHTHYDQYLPGIPKELSWMRQTAIEFEEGKVLHAVLLEDDLQEAVEDGLTSLNGSALKSYLTFQLHLSRSIVRLRFGLRVEGMTVLVMGRLGRGFALPPFALPPNWYQCALHLSDALALKWLENDWASYVWGVKNEVDHLRQMGLHIPEEGDDVRILGYWRAKRRIVPLDVGIPADDVRVNIDATFAGNLRAEARLGYDEHATYKPSQESWFRVAKLAGRGHFHELRALPIYGSIADAWARNLAGVVLTKKRSWWVEFRATGKNQEFHISYLLWDATMQWCGRVLPLVEDAALDIPPGNLEIFVTAELPPMDQILEIPASNELTAVAGDNKDYKIRITLTPAFLGALAEPTNRAERQLVQAIIDGVAIANGSRFPTADLLAKIVPNDQARFAYLFMARTRRDELSDIPANTAWLIAEQDSYNASLGIGAELGLPGRQTVTGKAKSQEFLHAAVDTLCDRVKTRLQTYNRGSLIRTVLRNIEAIGSDEVVWERTAAALMSIYRDQENVFATAQEQSGARNRTALTSRILLEMAVCECPVNGGVSAGRSDYMDLIGLVNTLILAAYNSDEIEYGLVDPNLEIWPNGEFGISNDFHDTILGPYQQGRFQDYFKKSAEDYSELFTPHEGKEPEEVFDQEFLSAWKEEFGFTIEQLVLVEEVLIQKARETSDRVVGVTVAEISQLLGAAGIESAATQQILDSLVLSPRDSWVSIPAGFHLRDIEPWKFGRRLSLLRRPLLGLTKEKSPEGKILYGAGLVHTAFSFTVGSAFSGSMSEKSFTSAQMKKWIGTVNHRNGNDFNETVRKIMESAGFHARASVQMREFGAEGIGDIDVLAWTEARDIALVIECKQLRFARTMAEVAEQLRRFRGRAGDDLYAHLRRVKWLTENPESLRRRIDLRVGFRIHQLLVTEKLVPMAFVKELAIPPETVIPAGRLRAAMQNRPLPGETVVQH